MATDRRLEQRVKRAVEARDDARAAADAAYIETLRELWAEGHSLAEIAAVLGVSRQYVHQLLR